ncbi:class I SAM-dependent methyltransferase [Lentibacillus salinarum]|uniref:Class I SAM-dependent methyltransferase n=1 Tax=Lentibacillus salinarum TaxID=446820 RepID=A0ABW3ZY76_9BACI
MGNNRYLDALALMGVGGAHPGGLFLTKKMLAADKIDAGMAVLDAGCGTGQTAAYIAEQFQCYVAALDDSEMMLKKARERFSARSLPVETRHGAIENLPWQDSSFDMIVSESVIAFTDIAQSIPEFKRVLKPDGTLNAVEMVLEKKLPEHEMTPVNDFYGMTRLLMEPEWLDRFYDAGFRDVQVETFNLPSGEVKLDNTPDFLLSENIGDEWFDILLEHEQLTALYREWLSFRIFRCKV